MLTSLRTRQACAEHRLDSVQVSSRPGFAVSVVLVSGGYPGEYSKGKHIEIGEIPSGKQCRDNCVSLIGLGRSGCLPLRHFAERR